MHCDVIISCEPRKCSSVKFHLSFHNIVNMYNSEPEKSYRIFTCYNSLPEDESSVSKRAHLEDILRN